MSTTPESKELICYTCLRLRKETGKPRKLKKFAHIRALAMHKKDAHNINLFEERREN